MPSYAHRKLIEQIARLDDLPQDPPAYSKWIAAEGHLHFLRANAFADEVVIYASGPFTFIHSLAVPNKVLSPATKDDLLRWSCNPYTTTAAYSHGGDRDEVWIDRSGIGRGSKALEQGINLVFGRNFEGWPDDERAYFEINQEYSHLGGIHWRSEQESYCRFDQNGDLEHVVSITARRDQVTDVMLVSFTWSTLERYLAVSDCSLVRMFDFTLLRRSTFAGWPHGPEEIFNESETFFYRQKRAAESAYTRGVQIISPRRPASDIAEEIKSGWSGRRSKQYVEFIAYDWRNKCITKISTDPKATTNYFEADENNLPYELSPAFFRPEVLSKYKSDREKYKVGDRDLQCRAAWSLRGYDVNEAGQIHAYICDLRDLPHTEQLHWMSYNEEPKATISERALVNDFKGEWVTFRQPREQVLSIVLRWRDRGVPWWTLRDLGLLDRANPPLTASKDEWAEAFMDLSKIVVEGFEIKTIRNRLREAGITYEENDQSIALLEKLMADAGRHSHAAVQFVGMRAVQRIRSKVKGHAGSGEAKKIAQDALAQHGTFAKHFDHICQLIAAELESIESYWRGSITPDVPKV